MMPFVFKVSKGLLENFFSSSISFNLDTIFINWNTSFPAVTICEIYSSEKMWNLTEKYYGFEQATKIDDFVSEIVFFRGECVTCAQCSNMTCPTNFTELMELFRSKCQQLISNCNYINASFDCCDEFLPVRTEYGICYAFNSQQASKNTQIKYKNSRVTGVGYLKFNASTNIQLHVHSPIDVPYLNSEGIIRETILTGTYKELILNVIEVFNHETINDLTIEQRRCRYEIERTDTGHYLDIFKFYSFPTCIIECTVALQLEHCNCTSHFMTTANKSQLPMCDYRGLQCLSNIYKQLSLERKNCNCISSCEEPEFDIVYNSADDQQDSQDEMSHIKVALVDLPTQRYVRRVAKTPLDLLISVGGIMGLFFNTSVLRLFEWAFLLTKRIFKMLHKIK